MGEKNSKRNSRVGMIVLVALIGAALCWRMVPRSFDSLLPDEQGSLRYISCTVHVPSYEDEETIYDTYRLDELTAGMEEYTAVLDILNGASYRPGFRNLIAPLVHGAVSSGQTDGRMATVTLLWEEESFSITFWSSGTMAVSIYPEGSLLVYYMIGTEACEELMTYIQGHGINESDDRLYYSYIPYGNLLLNAEGNMGLYTDDVYSIVDGQVTLIATGYRGLWAMQDGEIVALLDESYLKEIPAAKG